MFNVDFRPHPQRPWAFRMKPNSCPQTFVFRTTSPDRNHNISDQQPPPTQYTLTPFLHRPPKSTQTSCPFQPANSNHESSRTLHCGLGGGVFVFYQSRLLGPPCWADGGVLRIISSAAITIPRASDYTSTSVLEAGIRPGSGAPHSHPVQGLHWRRWVLLLGWVCCCWVGGGNSLTGEM